ncbi:MAG: hypothetical protein N3A54_01590 [Patescibacteria group bacterium]|nr:hypothetical protein [Patescibacteria group bacterium]
MDEIVIPKEEIIRFRDYIFSWWEIHKRDLPWRKTRDPYKVLISEFMLQQTQVSRVLPRYKQFLSVFPTVYDLAQASVADVLREWKGMGYNRRALYLKRLSEEIVQKYNGEFPRKEKKLLRLPGLGKYTARAVLVFAFNENVSLIDTNIRKIITYHFFNGILQKESMIQQVADQLLPEGKSWEWHQALMDYGAIVISKVRHFQKIKKKSTVPFRESNRFFRGRIIDYLREKSWNRELLVQEMTSQYGRDINFHRKILEDLRSEGLIEERDNGIISLPE